MCKGKSAFDAFMRGIDPVRGDAATAKHIFTLINWPIRHTPNNFANRAFAFALGTYNFFHALKVLPRYDIGSPTPIYSPDTGLRSPQVDVPTA